MQPPFYMQLTETVVIALLGVILWAATHTNSPITDTVTLYTLRTDAPEFKAFEQMSAEGITKVTAPTISLGVWYAINSTCMNPDAIQYLALTEPNFMSSANFPTVPISPADPAILPKLLSTPNLITSPLCRCLATTLIIYNTKNPTGVATAAGAKKADEGYKACYSTNGHTQQQRQWYETNYNTDKIHTRRSVSKVSFALVICLSFVFNLVYTSLSFSAEGFYSETWNIVKLAGLVVIAVLQLLLPAIFGNAAHTSSIISFFSWVIVPAIFFQFVLMEVAWAYLKTQNRAIHIHPYVFCTTLISLNAIALFETGVFDFSTHIYYMCISHALTMAYAATLFFTHFQKSESVQIDDHTLTGYIILLATATFIVISGAIPSHPTNCVHNLMVLLPWIFTVCVFGFSIFIEHTFKQPDSQKSKASSLYFEGHALLVLIVLGHFMLKLWHVSFGDTILSNAGGMIARYNFAFLFDMNPRFQTLYSVP